MTLFEKFPKLTVAAINVVIFTLFLGAGEVWSRYNTPYHVDFYRSPSIEEIGEPVKYPYWDIFINRFGYSDKDFILESPKPRVGYIGDFVNYGAGAGYPFRVSDYLETCFPYFEHWIFHFALVLQRLMKSSKS